MIEMKRLFTLLFLVPLIAANAQDIITLQQCYDDALHVHPLFNELKTGYKLWQLKDENIATGWLPALEAGADILYNTDIVDMKGIFGNIPIPGITDNIGSMPHDQYKITLKINQVIYDGGLIKNSRELEKLAHDLSDQEIKAQLYQVREKINNTFFGLILLEKQKELLSSYHVLISSKKAGIESGIRNGVFLPSDKSQIEAEKIKLEQEIRETNINISTLCTILSDLTGREINPGTELILPGVSTDTSTFIVRPEMKVFDLQLKNLEAGRPLIKSNRMPKAFGFATLGYGSPPGNNFFSDSFGPYAILGAGFSWKIFDYNQARRKEKIIDLKKQTVAVRKEDFENNIHRALVMKKAQIEQYISMLETDLELIKLRESISTTGESGYRNGTITSTEYLSLLNLEKEARLSYNIHLVNLIRAKVEYLNISGNEIQ